MKSEAALQCGLGSSANVFPVFSGGFATPLRIVLYDGNPAPFWFQYAWGSAGSDHLEATKNMSDPMPEKGNSALRRAGHLPEAEGRREAAKHATAARPKEIGGRNGPDPARFGDWEVKGIASDF